MTTRSSTGHAHTGDAPAAQGDAGADPIGADISGVLDTVDVPIVVVGRDCALVRFNRAAADVFGLAETDVGRLPGAVDALADVAELEKLCAQVIADEAPCRREIRNGDRRFVVRLAPYPAGNGRVEGAVLTFTNVTAFRASIEQAIYEREYTKAILNTVIDPLVVLDSGLRVQTANRAFYAMFGASREKTQGVPLRDLGDEGWKTSGLWTALGATASADSEFRPLEVERHFPTIGRRTVLLDARRLPRDGDATILLTFHDITDRKRAEEDLRRGQEELRDFVENASVGMHWVGPDGIIQWANRTELELLGYTREEFVGHHIAEFHVDAPVIENILRRLVGGETVQDCGVRLRCKDGSIRDVLLNSNVLWEGDRFIHTRCFTRDVTERKRAEEALRESERRFREMIDALPAAVYTTDAEGLLAHFNPACIELAGRVPEPGSDRWCVTWKLYRPDGTPIPRVDCPMAVALKEGRSTRGEEVIAERPDGTRVWFTPYPTPLRDAEGRIVGGINMLVDVTERKRAEQALRDSEARFRTLFESMDEGYCVIEVIFGEKDHPIDYRFLEVNPAFEKQTGIKDAEGRLMRAIAPEHEQHWFDIFGRIALTGETFRFENPAAALGRHYDVCAFRVGPPELRRVGIVFNDITERKKAEEVVRQSQKALLEADRRKDEFLALLAHELRNPLAPLRNGLHVLRLAADPGDRERAREMMERQLAHTVRLVDDLLDVSRISRNKMELRRSRVLLADVVSSAVETARPAVEEAGHELTVVLPPEPMHLDADLTRLAQVFGNLLTNSAKYTPRGGHVGLGAERQGEEVVISVRDDGIGIPAESLGSIFDMFSQVDRSIERSTGGLGIGLALVKGLVEMHGGTVTAESPGVGQGSTFTVRLPVLRERAESLREDPAEEGARAAGPRRRILVVDDNRDSAASLSLMLKLMGNEVRAAHDGVEAVGVAEAFGPEVILMDVGMPRLNGYEATRRIREQPWGRSVIIIALTGWGQEDDRLQSREAGCNGHLVKPVSLPDLEKLLAEAEASR